MEGFAPFFGSDPPAKPVRNKKQETNLGLHYLISQDKIPGAPRFYVKIKIVIDCN